MKDDLKIAAAESEVERSRAQLIDTVNEMATYYQPERLIDQAWATAKIKGAEIAEDAVDAVTSKPMLIGGTLAAIAAFLARKPIKAAAVRAYDAMTSSPQAEAPDEEIVAEIDDADVEVVIKKTPTRRRSATRRKVDVEKKS